MNLDEYLSKMTKVEREKFAQRLGYHAMYIYGVSKKHRQGSIELAVLIEKETGGKVPCWEVRSELHPDAKKRMNGKKRANRPPRKRAVPA